MEKSVHNYIRKNPCENLQMKKFVHNYIRKNLYVIIQTKLITNFIFIAY